MLQFNLEVKWREWWHEIRFRLLNPVVVTPSTGKNVNYTHYAGCLCVVVYWKLVFKLVFLTEIDKLFVKNESQYGYGIGNHTVDEYCDTKCFGIGSFGHPRSRVFAWSFDKLQRSSSSNRRISSRKWYPSTVIEAHDASSWPAWSQTTWFSHFCYGSKTWWGEAQELRLQSCK